MTPTPRTRVEDLKGISTRLRTLLTYSMPGGSVVADIPLRPLSYFLARKNCGTKTAVELVRLVNVSGIDWWDEEARKWLLKHGTEGPSPMMAPRLTPIDLRRGKESRHPDIEKGVSYLVKYDGMFYAGTFSEQHYGWNFNGGPTGTGYQFNTPGYNHSMWEGLWKIEHEG